MRRSGRIALWVLAILVGVPIALVLLVVAGLNTGPGRTEAAALVGRLTGGTVRLSGLSGRFPDRLRLAHLELRDTGGAWMEADDVALTWSPTALLHRQALVHELTAARLALPRLAASTAPVPDPAEPSKPVTLPVRVTIERLVLDRAEIGRALLGTDAVVAATGRADVPSLEAGTAALALRPVGAEGR